MVAEGNVDAARQALTQCAATHGDKWVDKAAGVLKPFQRLPKPGGKPARRSAEANPPPASGGEGPGAQPSGTQPLAGTLAAGPWRRHALLSSLAPNQFIGQGTFGNVYSCTVPPVKTEPLA